MLSFAALTASCDRDFLADMTRSFFPIQDTDATEGELCGPFDEIILQGLTHDRKHGSKGWAGLQAEAEDENGTIAIPFTSGTTSRPKGVEFTHRGAYMAALGNIVESGLNFHEGRCKYLWTLPLYVQLFVNPHYAS